MWCVLCKLSECWWVLTEDIKPKVCKVCGHKTYTQLVLDATRYHSDLPFSDTYYWFRDAGDGGPQSMRLALFAIN